MPSGIYTHIRKPIENRFWTKVRKTKGCWIWTAHTIKGYGRIKNAGRWNGMSLAHRISWIIHNGPISPHRKVLHHCDNPGCVNPKHLWLGSQQDNMRDAVLKGRVKPPNSKIGNTIKRKKYLLYPTV